MVCGHSHHAAIVQMNDIVYCNDGDWVETCSALVEHQDGRLSVSAPVEFDRLSAHVLPSLSASGVPRKWK
jgi:hypothetical protein